jgi:HK97 family phage portal protein
VPQSGGIVITVDSTSPMLGAAFGTGKFTPVRPGMSQALTNRQAYYDQLWVHVCINKLSRGLSRLPLKAYHGRGKDRVRLHTDTPGVRGDLARALDTPYPGANRFSLLNDQTTEYLIEGRSLSALLRDEPGAPPSQIVPMDPSQVTAIRHSQSGRLLYFEWRQHPTDDPVNLLPEDVLDLGFSKRVSPLRALTHTLHIEDAAQRSTRAFYANGSQPSGVFTVDRKLDADAVKSVEQQIKGEHRGADNHFKVAVLANVPGAKWQPFSWSAKDAETVGIRKLGREEVCAAFDVPPPLVGILDQATFSNIDTQTRMWVVDTLAIHGVMVELGYIAQLIRREPAWEGCYVEFDLGELMRGTPLQQAESFGKLLNSGARTPNEIRDLQNLPRIEDDWADGIYVPSNLAPIGTPGPLHTGSTSGGSGSGSSAAAQNPNASAGGGAPVCQCGVRTSAGTPCPQCGSEYPGR